MHQLPRRWKDLLKTVQERFERLRLEFENFLWLQHCGVFSRSENGGASEPLPKAGTANDRRNENSGRKIYTGSQSMAYRRDFQEVHIGLEAGKRQNSI